MLLTPAEYTATAEKIGKLNDRSRRRGWTGEIRLRGDFVEHTETGPGGVPVKTQMVDAEITGEPPKYDGWTFLARAECDNDSGLIVYGAPGADPVDRKRIRSGECDHCGLDRNRKAVFIVKHEDGREMQVGSSCLKDFLGWNINPVWISEDVSSFTPDGGWGRVDPTYSTETVLAFAWAAIQAFGYVRASDYYKTPTKSVVLSVLHPTNAAVGLLREDVLPHRDGGEAMAKTIRAWVLAQPDGNSDYMPNLKGIAAGQFVSYKKFGFLVSAPQAWARAQERDLIRKRETAEVCNEWNGKPGDKLTLRVKLTSIRPVTTDWGVSDLYTFVGCDDKRVYKWFSTRTVFDKTSDEPVTITGTVKKLDEFKGSKSTVLTRVKVA